MGVDAAAGTLVVPQAERAIEVAPVGGVHIQVVPVFIGDGKALFPKYRSLRNQDKLFR